jgi:type IV pilus assembly protein PilN
MAKINLLPWRAERRKLRQREFYMMLGAATVAAVLGVLVWWFWMDARISNQDARNTYMTGQINDLNKKLEEIKDLEDKRSQLLARKKAIEELQANRAQMVHMFDELVKTTPDSVRLTGLKQTGDTLTLEGVAQSNEGVATYMNNLDKSLSLEHSDLQKTEAKGSDKRNRFEFGVTVKLKKPKDDQDAGNGGNPAPPPSPAKPATPRNPGAQVVLPIDADVTPTSPRSGGKP